MLNFIKVLIFIIFHITDQTAVWNLIKQKILLDNRVQDKNNE